MTSTTMRLPPTLSVDKTAQYVKVSTKTMRRLIAHGELPAHWVRTCRCISKKELSTTQRLIGK